MLSSLLGPVKDIESPLSINGDFPLNKRLPTDRVSGSITLSMVISLSKSDKSHQEENLLVTPPSDGKVRLFKSSSRNSTPSSNSPMLTRQSQTLDSDGADSSRRRLGDEFGISSTNAPDVHSSESSLSLGVLRNLNINQKDENILSSSNKPVLSNKLSQRIGKFRRKTNESDSTKCIYNLPSSISVSPIDSTLVPSARDIDFPATYGSSTSDSISRGDLVGKSYDSFRVANISKQLDSLRTSLQVCCLIVLLVTGVNIDG